MNITLYVMWRSINFVKYIYYFNIYMGYICLDMYFIVLLKINPPICLFDLGFKIIYIADLF